MSLHLCLYRLSSVANQPYKASSQINVQVYFSWLKLHIIAQCNCDSSSSHCCKRWQDSIIFQAAKTKWRNSNNNSVEVSVKQVEYMCGKHRGYIVCVGACLTGLFGSISGRSRAMVMQFRKMKTRTTWSNNLWEITLWHHARHLYNTHKQHDRVRWSRL